MECIRFQFPGDKIPFHKGESLREGYYKGESHKGEFLREEYHKE